MLIKGIAISNSTCEGLIKQTTSMADIIIDITEIRGVYLAINQTNGL